MGVVERVRNLLSVDLAEIESPADAPARLQRYLRDLEGAYREITEACRRTETTREYLEEKARGNAAECRRWTDRAELALRHDSDSLARVAVAKKKVLLAEGKDLARDLELCIVQQRELAREISHLQERILAVRSARSTSLSPSTSVSEEPFKLSLPFGLTPQGGRHGEPSFRSEVEKELATLKSRLNRSR
ncbi:MAG: PspA/IM30 family protein [Planctomycetota bacterium]